MKHSKKLAPIIAALALVVVTGPAYALDVGVMTNANLDIKTEDGRTYKGEDSDKSKNDDRDDDRKSEEGKKGEDKRENIRHYNRIKAWIVDVGTTGKVIAINGTTLTIKNAKGEVYTVATADATIRRGSDSVAVSSILVGDKVFVMGVKNGTFIVASTIVTAKNSGDLKPTTEEKRRAYFGSITAKTDTALTIVTSDNVTYTVTTTGAQVWINKTKQSSLANLAVGEKVMIQGTLSGSTLAAKSILAVHFPEGIVAGKITAINDTTLTVLGTDNKIYTVTTVDADIKVKKDNDAAVSDLKVGSTVVVKGDVSGTDTIAADTVAEGKVKAGFFARFGTFFKGIFGKK